MKILIVDDQKETCLLLSKILTRCADGVEVKICTTGAECLRVTTKWNPDCILLDVMMPDERGCEVLKKIRRDGFAGGVVMFTCVDDYETIEESFRAGCDFFLVKTAVKPSELCNLIISIVQGTCKRTHLLRQE